MRGRLLFFVCLFGLEMVVFLAITVYNGSPRDLPPFGFVTVTFAYVVMEVGRRNGGRVSQRWIVGLGAVTLVALILGMVGVAQSHSIFHQVPAIVVLAAVVSVVPIVLVKNHQHRLGVERRPVSSGS